MNDPVPLAAIQAYFTALPPPRLTDILWSSDHEMFLSLSMLFCPIVLVQDNLGFIILFHQN